MNERQRRDWDSLREGGNLWRLRFRQFFEGHLLVKFSEVTLSQTLLSSLPQLILGSAAFFHVAPLPKLPYKPSFPPCPLVHCVQSSDHWYRPRDTPESSVHSLVLRAVYKQTHVDMCTHKYKCTHSYFHLHLHTHPNSCEHRTLTPMFLGLTTLPRTFISSGHILCMLATS